jgi:hypothetical protein
MKTLKHLWVLAILFTPFAGSQLNAQDNARPEFVVLTRTHWNMDKNLPDDDGAEWEALEKEYLEKVTKKNDLVMSTELLTHFYTADNSEVILVGTYRNWNDIEAAQDKYDELEKAAWPDEAKRKAFHSKLDKYYENRHSDEIYATQDGAKISAMPSDSSMVIYMQKVYMAFPEDGTRAEFEQLRLEYNKNVIQKNPFIHAYYPLRHAWGADNREFVNVYVVKSFCDISEMNKATAGLVAAAWPDETKRKAFMKKYNRYYSGVHGDYIYSSNPQVSK